MKPFLTCDDAMGNHSPVLAPSDYVLAVHLAPDTPRTIAIPPDARIVLFSATGPFWARFAAPATVPATDILDGTAPELNPAGRSVFGIGQLGLAAATACIVNLVFYG